MVETVETRPGTFGIQARVRRLGIYLDNFAIIEFATRDTDGKQSRIDASLHLCVSALAISLRLAESAYGQWERDKTTLAVLAESGFMTMGRGRAISHTQSQGEVMEPFRQP
jgi:hypothetical protein